MILELAIRGKGVALLPDFLCSDFIGQGELEHICRGWHTGKKAVSIVTPSHRKKSAAIELFSEFLFTSLNGKLA